MNRLSIPVLSGAAAEAMCGFGPLSSSRVGKGLLLCCMDVSELVLGTVCFLE